MNQNKPDKLRERYTELVYEFDEKVRYGLWEAEERLIQFINSELSAIKAEIEGEKKENPLNRKIGLVPPSATRLDGYNDALSKAIEIINKRVK